MRSFFRFFLHLGALGLVGMGILDSSFLFVPSGNDFLLIALTARNHQNLILNVISAALGSVLGVALLDLVCRRGGEEGLKRLMSGPQLKRIKQRVKSNAVVMILLATLAPPPFPFTAIIAAASAFQYPRARLFTFVALGRLIRFSILGWVAIVYGRSIIRFMRLPEFRYIVAGFAVLCVVGSIFSVLRWRSAS